MNEFDLLSSPQDNVAIQVELAKALKRKNNLGTVAQLSGDKILAPFGRDLINQADQYARQAEQSRQATVDDKRTRTYQDAQIKQMTDVLNERIRDSKQDDATTRRGQDLALQSALYRSMLSLEGKAPPRITEGDKRRLEALTGELNAYNNLEDFFGKGGKLGAVEISGLPIPFLRGALNKAAEFGYGTPQTKASFAAKQEFDRLYTLATRNKLFGATLTKQEKDAFDAANPSIRQTDDQIKGAMGAMKKIVRAKLSKTTKALQAEGYNRDALEAYGFDSSLLEDEEAPTPEEPAAPQRTFENPLTPEEREEMIRIKKALGLP